MKRLGGFCMLPTHVGLGFLGVGLIQTLENKKTYLHSEEIRPDKPSGPIDKLEKTR